MSSAGEMIEFRGISLYHQFANDRPASCSLQPSSQQCLQCQHIVIFPNRLQKCHSARLLHKPLFMIAETAEILIVESGFFWISQSSVAVVFMLHFKRICYVSVISMRGW